MSATTADRTAMDSAVRHLISHYNPRGNRVGWLMMSSILVEAWDLYSIAFVLIFISQQYHPDPWLLGLAGAGTQGGALIGALIGGWLSDKIGRRVMFLSTMVMFIVLALAQAFVPNVTWLIVVRLFLGIPLGSDISNGYTYIMESMPKGAREVMGNRWQFMFAVGEILTLAVIALFLWANLNPEYVWRITLGLGAVPAAVILAMRHDLPETAVWLIRRGRFREAKQVTRVMFQDSLDMLPDHDVVVPKPRPTAFIADIKRDPIRWRATIYGWISCFCQGSEFATFGFYLPVLFASLGVAGALGNDLVTMALYIVAAISGWIGPLITPKIGHRGIGIAGFGIVLVSLIVAAWAIWTGHNYLLIVAAASMLWGHYWDASNCMTIPTMVARPEYRGTASGFSYMFVKLPSFLSIFLFPSLFAAIGQAGATLFVAIFPLVGFLAAVFILPEAVRVRARPRMKITALETLRTREFFNVLWVRVHTDAGVVGLGETFYGAGAVEAHIHDTLALRLLGRDPLRIEFLHREMLNLPNAQASTGVEDRAASAIDIALWDLFGKVCGQPVHQMLGGLCRDRQRIYNTCAGYAYVRSADIKPVSTWNFDDAAGPYEDLQGFMTRADALAESLLEQGITAMKIWPFDPAALANEGRSITPEQLKTALEPFEKIRRAVGDRMEIMVELHSLWNLPMAKRIAKWLEPYDPTWYEDPIRMTSPQALAELAASTPVWICASETLGSRFPYKDLLERDATHVVMADLCWTGGLTEGRKIAALAETYHRPFAPHDCIGPVGFIAGVHASFSQPNTLIQESVRAFYTGWYKELVTELPIIDNGFVLPMEGAGLGTELLPSVFERGDLTVRRTDL